MHFAKFEFCKKLFCQQVQNCLITILFHLAVHKVSLRCSKLPARHAYLSRPFAVGEIGFQNVCQQYVDLLSLDHVQRINNVAGTLF